MNRIYVVRHGDEWASRVGGASRASRVFSTQKAAIDYARPVAKASHAELYIQGRDGRFRDSDSHGNDPRNIPG